MKRIVLAMLLGLLPLSPALAAKSIHAAKPAKADPAAQSAFQVRLALDESEAKTIAHDSLPYQPPGKPPVQLSVSKDILLSKDDVQYAVIHTEGTGGIQFVLTDKGRAKLRDITTQYVGMPMAIIGDGRVLAAPVIKATIHGGRITLSAPWTDAHTQESADDLKTLAAKLGIKLQDDPKPPVSSEPSLTIAPASPTSAAASPASVTH